VLGSRPEENDKTMRKARKHPEGADDLRREYRFDYSKAKPNRFASQFGTASVAVVLDPDVASVFRTSEAVNKLLRSVVSAIPRRASQRAAARRGQSNKQLQRTALKRRH